MIYGKAVVLLLGAALCEARPQLAEPEVAVSVSSASPSNAVASAVPTPSELAPLPPAQEVVDPVVEETPAAELPALVPGQDDTDAGQEVGQPLINVPPPGQVESE